MVKLNSVLMLLVLSLLSFKASAISVTVNVDDPSRVKVYFEGKEDAPYTLNPGDNPIDIDLSTTQWGSGYLYIEPTDGNLLLSVNSKESDGTESKVSVYDYKKASPYLSSRKDGIKFTIVTAAESSVRTAKAIVNVDDASLVRFSRNTETLTLNNGSNEVLFIPEGDNAEALHVTSKSSDHPLYSVKYNNVEMERPDGTQPYDFDNPKNNDKIDIVAVYPQENRTVTINLLEETPAACIKTVRAAGELVSDFRDISVNIGDKLDITFDTDLYSIDDVVVNGVSKKSMSSYSTVVLDNLTLGVKAHKYATFNVTFDVDDPARVTVSRVISMFSRTPIELKAGKDNVVEFTEQKKEIEINAATNCYLVSVNDGTKDLDVSEGSLKMEVADGMVVTIRSAEIVRDKTMVVYFDDNNDTKESTLNITWGVYPNAMSHKATEGYSQYNYYAGDIPFSTYVYDNVKAYLDDTEIPFTGYYSKSGKITPAADAPYGVFKIYTYTDEADAPKSSAVTFDIADDAKDAVKVTRDLIVPVTDFAAAYNALPGTQYVIEPKEGAKVKVSVNDTDVALGDNGKYTFSVTEPTTVKITKEAAVAPTDGDRYDGKVTIDLAGMGDITGGGQETTIYIVPTTDGKCTFSLPNFSLDFGDGPQSLGDIVVPDVTVTKEGEANKYVGHVSDMKLAGGEITADVDLTGTVDAAGVAKMTINVVWKQGEDNVPILVEFNGQKVGSSGIGSIDTDNADAPVEYYNLQGIRVDNPENGVYIRRQGNTVTKVLVK